MRFVLKALFFLAVVAAFIPRQPDAEAGTPVRETAAIEVPAAPALSGVQINLEPEALADSALCADQQNLCDVARESAAAARLIGGVAAAQARRAFDEAMTRPATPAPGADIAPAPAS